MSVSGTVSFLLMRRYTLYMGHLSWRHFGLDAYNGPLIAPLKVSMTVKPVHTYIRQVCTGAKKGLVTSGKDGPCLGGPYLRRSPIENEAVPPAPLCTICMVFWSRERDRERDRERGLGVGKLSSE